MTPFITFRDEDKNKQLQYYILQRAFPYYVGQIVTMPKEGSIINKPIPSYKMWVTFVIFQVIWYMLLLIPIMKLKQFFQIWLIGFMRIEF